MGADAWAVTAARPAAGCSEVSFWSAAAIKVYGSRSDDAQFLDSLSRTIGQYDAKVRSSSTSKDGSTRSEPWFEDKTITTLIGPRLNALTAGQHHDSNSAVEAMILLTAYIEQPYP